MSIELSTHAKEECQRRNISMVLLEEILKNPQQKLTSYGHRHIYQSKVMIEGKAYLIRAIIDEQVDPMRVITVYRTSKIEKYWEDSL
jgi:hypothetical protein